MTKAELAHKSGYEQRKGPVGETRGEGFDPMTSIGSAEGDADPLAPPTNRRVTNLKLPQPNHPHAQRSGPNETRCRLHGLYTNASP